MRHDDPARTCPDTARSPARAGGGGPGPLDAAEAAFRALTTGPRPLALNPGRLAAGLPDRTMPLGEMRALLLHPATSPAARNKVWAELVRRARAGDPAWVVGLAGVAMPGLRRAAASLSAGWRGDTDDLQAEILAGFLAALRALDLDDLDRVPLASRLCWAAWRAGQKHALASAAWASRRRDLDSSGAGPALPWGHPDFVLAAAIRAKIITAAEAELIGRNRLEGIPLSAIAAETGVSHSALCHRRRRAETRLIRAISDGILADPAPIRPPGVKNATRTRISDSGEVPSPRPPGPGAARSLTPPAADREGRQRPARPRPARSRPARLPGRRPRS
jgi:hypothetical protein